MARWRYLIDKVVSDMIELIAVFTLLWLAAQRTNDHALDQTPTIDETDIGDARDVLSGLLESQSQESRTSPQNARLFAFGKFRERAE
jgi:hypothetical protein